MKNENAVRCERLIPVVALVLMVIHIVFLLLGIKEHITEIILICSGFYITHAFSKCLRFCLLHRIMIMYAYAVMVCTWWQRHGLGFGAFLTPARIFMLLVGCIILIYAIYGRRKKGTC